MKILLLLVIVFITTACSSSQSEHIPLVVYDAQDEYIQDFAHQINDNAGEQFSVDLYDSQNSQVKQNSIVDEVLDEDPKAIIINMVDRVGAYPIIERAKEKDIPLLFINREPLKRDLKRYDKAFYIGSDAHQSAQMQADMIMEHFQNLADGETVKTAILMGQQGHQDAEIRTSHIVEILESSAFPLQLVDIKVANFSQSDAYEQTLSLIDEHETIDLIISNNDAMAIGAIDALIELENMPPYVEGESIDIEQDPWLPVIGVDGLPISHDYLKSNHYYGTVLQDSSTMAHAISEMVNLFIEGDALSTYSYEVSDDHYIWIDYQEFCIENE